MKTGPLATTEHVELCLSGKVKCWQHQPIPVLCTVFTSVERGNVLDQISVCDVFNRL